MVISISYFHNLKLAMSFLSRFRNLFIIPVKMPKPVVMARRLIISDLVIVWVNKATRMKANRKTGTPMKSLIQLVKGSRVIIR